MKMAYNQTEQTKPKQYSLVNARRMNDFNVNGASIKTSVNELDSK